MNRRSFVLKSMAGAAMAGMPVYGLSAFNNIKAAGIGICDWDLGHTADNPYTPSTTADIFVPRAASVGLEGIQVSLGTSPDHVMLRDPSVRKHYIELGKRHNISYFSVAVGSILHYLPLTTEPQSAVFVIDGLEAARALGSKNILIAFFFDGDLLEKDKEGNYINMSSGKYPEYKWKEKDIDRLIALLKQIAPRAEDHGIALGIENSLSADQNLTILEEVGSPMVQVYYDIGNSWQFGYNVPREIRQIGNHRMCEVHIKNVGSRLIYGNEGQVDMESCANALADIGYDKWLVLETIGRPGRFEEDTLANIDFVKRVFR
ncbi:MAG: sugar phosphate isomerase/epimerase [Cyclobacteriaceae bacterium]|nr:sugar phosphate isomerase/epimerase [Cyclobacteriaceae bacterium]